MREHLTKRRLLAGLVAVSVALVLVTATAWATWPRTGGNGIGIDLNLPKIGEAQREGFWFPVVVNDTGSTIDKATFELSVHDHASNLDLADSVDTAREKYEDFVPATGETCEVPAGGAAGTPPVGDDYMRYDSSVSCEKPLKPGANKYSLWMRAAGHALEAFADGESESVTVKARVKAGGEVLAAVTQKLRLDRDPRAHRVTVEHIPQYIETDRTESKPHKAKLVITNDSDADLSGGVLSVVTDPYSGFGLSGGESCRNPDTESGEPTSLICEDVDIPAGESVTVKLRIYANPDGFDVERMKKHKLYVKVGTDAAGARTGDFAKKSRFIWMGAL